jgi:hypothetical protein
VGRDHPDHGTVSYLLTKPDVAIFVAFFAHPAAVLDLTEGSLTRPASATSMCSTSLSRRASSKGCPSCKERADLAGGSREECGGPRLKVARPFGMLLFTLVRGRGILRSSDARSCIYRPRVPRG